VVLMGGCCVDVLLDTYQWGVNHAIESQASEGI
jgi:hypothetical protein